MTFIYTVRDNPPSPDRLVTRHCRLLSGLPWLRGLRAQVFVWPELSSERQSGPGCAGRVLVPYSTRGKHLQRREGAVGGPACQWGSGCSQRGRSKVTPVWSVTPEERCPRTVTAVAVAAHLPTAGTSGPHLHAEAVVTFLLTAYVSSEVAALGDLPLYSSCTLTCIQF